MKKDHYLLRFIKYGSKHEKFTLNDAYDYIGLSEGERKMIDQEIRGSDLIAHDGAFSLQRDKQISLSIEAIFKNIEYEELRDARKSSKRATIFAIAAIVISIIVGVIQILIPQQVEVVNGVYEQCFERIG